MIYFNKNPKNYGIMIIHAGILKKLWIRLIDKGIKNKTDLIPLAGISTNILAKLNKGEYVSMNSLDQGR